MTASRTSLASLLVFENVKISQLSKTHDAPLNHMKLCYHLSSVRNQVYLLCCDKVSNAIVILGGDLEITHEAKFYDWSQFHL